MIHRLAMETQGTFAAFVSVAGMMKESVWEERRDTNTAGFFQITGEKDDVVPKNSDGSAAYAKAPAIEDVMEYWADSNGLKESETMQIGNDSALIKYRGKDTFRQVWHLVISDGHHSWPSEQYNQINTNALILEFLDSQGS
jgi:poly(3-hydroxybutyrate) depolymerase